MSVKHVGSSWIVDERIIVTAALTDKGTWQLIVNGVRDASEYDSPEDAFDAGLPAAEEMASIVRQIEALQTRLTELGVGADE